ncbi:hypothetical protein [Dysgonomonas sp. HGC4]|uniref:hypothetical protein n=1 Tax=Dysgonomonas sp. HGC4 TaxID=1658009 RepID=UPI0006806731|nr:hypothetical protein [Dysgonomonas sp. HGC4]MBD8348583.1 hypothetical protein [Dysgonomonas sp. HGC4]
MTATAEQIEKGKEIAKDLKVKKLYLNDKGEFFTSQNLASLSVKADKKKYTTLDYSTTSLASADELEELAQIYALETVEEVDEILDVELEGEGRREIIEACETRKQQLQNPE